MSTQVQFRRGNTVQTSTFTGAVAEITVDTDKETLVVHDGTTAGGFALARESSVSANAIFSQAAFNQANASFITATSAGIYANAAFVQANTAVNNALSASNYANAAFSVANNITGVDTTQNNSITAAYTRANNSINANTGGTITGDLVVTGNLTISGTTTYSNTQQLLVGDNLITLNADLPTSVTPVENAGIEVNRGNTFANASLLWVESAGKWQANTGSATGAYFLANEAAATSAGIYANGAFTQANTDYTTLSTTAGVYGNAAFHPVVTLTANGRVSSITNTAISISADAITSGTLSNTRGGTGTTSSTGTGSVVLGTAPTITLPTINNIRQGYSTTVTAAGTTSLTVNSNYLQFFTGTTTQILTLPAPQTMTLGMGFFVVNNSTGNIEVRASNAAAVATILAGTAMLFVSIDLTAGNGAAGWSAEIVGFSTVTGTGAAVLNTSPTLSNISVTGSITSSGNVTANSVIANNSIYSPIYYSPGGLSRLELTDIGLVGIGVAGQTYQFGGSGLESNQGMFGGSFGGNRLSLNNETNLISNRYDTVKIQTGTDGTIVNEFVFANNSFSVPGTLTTVVANITSTTASTSNTTGALKVAGGVGVKGNVTTDGVIFADGTRQTTAATAGATLGDALALAIALG
jgi:hypothetical protein